MSRRIDCYHVLISPWSCLAVHRFNALRRERRANSLGGASYRIESG